jgi:hypothetical protein
LWKDFEFYIVEIRLTGRKTMRAAGIKALFLLLIIPLFFGAFALSPAKKLPPQVFEFYEDWNHLYAYSTREERMTLLSSLETPLPPSGKDSQRLSDVLHWMRKIKDRILFGDQKMIAKTKKQSPLLRNLFYRTELVEVQEFLKSGVRLSVKLAVVELEPEDVFRYIDRYVEDKKQEYENLFFKFRDSGENNRLKQRTEYHEWVLVNGLWKKNDGSFLLLIK